jgi:hypothetical protein
MFDVRERFLPIWKEPKFRVDTVLRSLWEYAEKL